ncbi:putative 26S proteasome subunit yta6 [Sorochytrium milnesiophthora]
MASRQTGPARKYVGMTALQAQEAQHNEAYKLISQALEMDQAGNSQKALSLYQQGKVELETALALQFTPAERTDPLTAKERKQGKVLADKMTRNLDMVNGRITDLGGAVDKTPARNPAKDVSAVRKRLSTSAADGSSRPASAKTATRSTASTRLHSASTKSASPDGPSLSSIGKAAKSKDTPSKDKAARQEQVTLSREKASSSQYLKNVDSKLANMLLNDVITDAQDVEWDDIAGLAQAKQALKEIVILPSLRPELFTGLRAPARGVLLYGPPGTGKTMLAKAVAHEANSTFFCMSASSLTSKFVGESEKLVKTLFALAKELSPSIIFIDEVDSILTERSESEHEASRRLKTQFLLEFDGVASNPEERILVMGATNRPQELDEAARRRFVRRIYVPLPDVETRRSLFDNLLKDHRSSLSAREITALVNYTDGYSASDITALAREASLGPIRELGDKIMSVANEAAIRDINYRDFKDALTRIKASVSKQNLVALDKWSQQFGSLGA